MKKRVLITAVLSEKPKMSEREFAEIVSGDVLFVLEKQIPRGLRVESISVVVSDADEAGGEFPKLSADEVVRRVAEMESESGM